MVGITSVPAGPDRAAQRRDQPGRPALDGAHGAKRGVHEQHAALAHAQRAKLLGHLLAGDRFGHLRRTGMHDAERDYPLLAAFSASAFFSSSLATMWISTRRFFARPASEALLATGRVSPRPSETSRARATPACER